MWTFRHSEGIRSLVVLLTWCVPTMVGAQQDVQASLAGARVRVTTFDSGTPVIGTVTSLGPGEVQLSQADGTLLSLPRDEIDRVERSLGQGSKTMTGLLWGGGIGLGIGGAVYLWLEEELSCSDSSCDRAAAFSRGAGMGLLVGGLIGAAIGSAVSGEVWEAVDLGPSSRFGILLQPDAAAGRGMLVGLVYPFGPR